MYRFFDWLSRVFALLGGLVLTALILITCISIIGRTVNGLLHSDWLQSIAPELAKRLLDLGIGPINGDFELVEAGMAFAIFAFLPLCQIRGAHASVDVFTGALSRRAKSFLQAIIDVVFAAVLILIAWQLFEGTLSKRNSGQTTFLLEFPIWWAYAVSLVAALVAAFVSVYVACTRVVESLTGDVILPLEVGAEH